MMSADKKSRQIEERVVVFYWLEDVPWHVLVRINARRTDGGLKL
jgi:hypothetical protein